MCCTLFCCGSENRTYAQIVCSFIICLYCPFKSPCCSAYYFVIAKYFPCFAYRHIISTHMYSVCIYFLTQHNIVIYYKGNIVSVCYRFNFNGNFFHTLIICVFFSELHKCNAPLYCFLNGFGKAFVFKPLSVCYCIKP